MAYTESDLEAVRSVIKQGLRSVVFEDGRQVHFRTLNDLLRVEQEILKSLDKQPQRRAYVVRTTKGL